eukprot:gene14193-19045_t
MKSNFFHKNGNILLKRFSAAPHFATTKSMQLNSSVENQLNDNIKYQWGQIELMRKSEIGNWAPIETMGADALSNSNNAVGQEYRFQTLIGTMLSPQTKDQQTSMAFHNLVKLVQPDPFLPNNLQKYTIDEIEKEITMVSFYKIKAINIHAAAVKCTEEFNNDIPDDIDDLLSFKGIGPKIGYLTLTIAYNKTVGICVDTHVHRIVN